MSMSHRNLKNTAMVVLAVFLLVAMSVFAYCFAKRRSLDDMHRVLASRAEFYAATLGGILSKYEFLPLAVAQSAEVADLLQHKGASSVVQVNDYLKDLNTRVGAFAVYMLDTQGLVLASSNWQESTSYVGQNYAFRPYFQQAVQGGIGHFYGIGVSTGEAGLFISQPVRRGGRIIGVVAAKVSLDWIERSWSAPAVVDQIWVSDANGVVILSSIPGLKFTTLAPLSDAQRMEILVQRQFLREPLPAVNHPVREEFADGAKVVSLTDPASDRTAPSSKGEFLAVGHSLAPLEWRMTVLSDLAPVRTVARNAALGAMLVWAVIMLSILYARQRRRRIHERLAAQAALTQAYGELEIKVEQRTSDLLDTNQRLHAEVVERERAEQTLRYAQAELVQSGKLAAIGQMAAGITHELNQPLAALQTFSDNARAFIVRGRTAEALENLSVISDLVKRLGYITSQLKAFARRSDDAKRPIHVQRAFAQAMLLMHTRIAAEQVQLTVVWPDQPLLVLCSEIGLEQVFTNLLQNAMDAMAESGCRRIEVGVMKNSSYLEIHIADTGPGIPGALSEKIFDPFFTTRQQGLGLGLSISAGIVRAAGGLLSARNRTAQDGGGAEFIIRLMYAAEGDAGNKRT